MNSIKIYDDINQTRNENSMNNTKYEILGGLPGYFCFLIILLMPGCSDRDYHCFKHW